MSKAYPLTWPSGFPRTARRAPGAFKASLSGALNNVEQSLRLFAEDSEQKVVDLVISSNVTLGQQRPTDPGVAVWFTWHGLQVCIPVDRYASVEANLQAIHHIIEARRTELRHGGLSIVRATFTGFAALPAPTDWRRQLGFSQGSKPELADVERSYRLLRSTAHPDRPGGDGRQFDAIQRAWEMAQQELQR